MELEGWIVDVDGENVTMRLKSRESLSKLSKYTHGYLDSVCIEIADGRKISPQQRKFAWAIISDIARAEIGGWWAGNRELIHDYFKTVFAITFETDGFSLARNGSSMSECNDYINLLLAFCLKHDVSLSRKPIEELLPSEVQQFAYMCLMQKRCVICGKPADLHHLDGSRIGIGNNRNHVNHLGRLVLPLCREHHNAFHANESALMDKYHLDGIKVNQEIANVYRLHSTGGNDDRNFN